MDISAIGVKEDSVARLKVSPGDTVRVLALADFATDPIGFVKFLRRAKKNCMVLYWRMDQSVAGQLPRLPASVLIALIRLVVQKPGGPPMVIEDATGTSRWRALGDFAVEPGSDPRRAIREAFFKGECGNPEAIYSEPMQRERVEWLRANVRGQVLEIGCSTGAVLHRVGGGVGVDVDELRLEYARRKFPESRYLSCDASKMPFKDREFDTVMIPDILEHVELPHAERIVREARRVGKRLIITVPNAGKVNYNKTLVENPEHRWFPTEAIMRGIVGDGAVIGFSQQNDFIYVSVGE